VPLNEGAANARYGRGMANPGSLLRHTSRVGALLLGVAILVALAVLAALPASTGLAAPGDHASEGLSELESCSYQLENGPVAADCGTLNVPETRSDASSELIALPVVRIRTAGSDTGAPLFRLGGGPGITNMKFPQAGRFTDDRDVVLVGYRGVDGSRRLDCPEVVSVQQTSADLVHADTLRGVAAAFDTCAHRLTASGIDLTAYTLAQRVDDLEAARVALGYDRVDLLSSSAGTRMALVYSWRYPESIERSAMVSVNPPGRFVWDADITDSQFSQYGTLCRADAECSARTSDLEQTVRDEAGDLPDAWGPLRIKEGNVRTLSMFGLQHNRAASAPMTAPTILDAYLSGAEGDASSYFAMSVMADLFLPATNVYGEFASLAMIDAPTAEDYYANDRGEGSILRGAGTDFLWAGPDGLASVWPDSPDNAQYRTPRPSTTDTLLVSGSVDFSTPAETATHELLPILTNGRQIVLRDLGHTADYWEYEAATGSTILTDFYSTGDASAPASVVREVDFTPVVPTMSDIGKIIAGVAAALALLALVILFATGWHVHRHGGFRTGWRSVPRALAAIPVGLGAWTAGALIAWTLFPSVSILNPLLVTVTVGITVGVYSWLITRSATPTNRRAAFEAPAREQHVARHRAGRKGRRARAQRCDGPLSVRPVPTR
jgi:pimeloyl-ACP methyl ester carboxylesterase